MSNTVCSSVQHLIKDVICAKIGICAREIELVQVSTGKPALEKKRNVAIDDRFKLKIPVTDQFMTWEVVFNCSLPNCPPDFDLNDIDFFYSVTLDSMEELIPSLNNWDHRKDNALINVISELRSAYLKYQVEKLENIDNRCAYEYSSLINDSKLPAEQVEVFVDSSTVHFLFKLDVDLTPILPSTNDYMVVLAVKFGAHGNVRSANIITSPHVIQLIGTHLELPRNIKNDESLSEYAEEVKSSIENQVLMIIQKRQAKRKQFIFELLKHLGLSVLSYDTLEYSKASFLLEKDGFLCVLEVSLPSQFPLQSPHYRLLSVYSTVRDGKPLSQVVNLPFCESWDIPTMVDQALNLIRDKKILNFRDTSVQLFQHPK